MMDEQKKMTTEEEKAQAKAIVNQLLKEGKKLIPFNPPMSESSSSNLKQGISILTALNEEISSIAQEVKEQSNTISTKLTQLKDEPEVSVNIDVEESQKGVDKYLELLHRIMKEVDQETTSLSSYAALTEKTALPVFFNEPGDFDSFISATIKRVKKQAKKIKKDLHVSYSRYTFSFQGHSKRIAQIEAYVGYSKKIKAAQDAATQQNNAQAK